MTPIVEAASPCPDCGDQREEAVGYPEDPTGRCRVYLICRSCGDEEHIGWDGVI